MKKSFIFLLLLTFVSTFFIGCGGGTIGGDGEVTPEYASVYSYDESGHWYAQTNGSGRKGYESHDNNLGRCKCGKYFETDDLLYKLCYLVDENEEVIFDDETGKPTFYYSVAEYLGYGEADLHIEIPAYHYQPINYDEDSDDYDEIIGEYAEDKEYPVWNIEDYVFSPKQNSILTIESIKLNEGLRWIGGGAFSSTHIVELIVPNSVEGELYNVCGGCILLETVVIGDGVTALDGYCFSDCTMLKNVTIGKSVRHIRRRVFYCCKSLRGFVIPASVVSIPEYEIYSNAVKKYVKLVNIFEGGYAPDLFFEITEEEYNALILEPLPRNQFTGLTINPETGEDIPYNQFVETTYGIADGWCGVAKLYFKGEWHYDENGRPVAN